MNDEPVALLAELATAYDAEIIDLWGRSTLMIRNAIDVAQLAALSERPGFKVQLLFGDTDIELTLGSGPPDANELVMLEDLLTNDRERSELAAIRTYLEAERLLHGNLSGAFVEYSRHGWARTELALVDAARANWVDVVKEMPAHSLAIGSSTVLLERIDGPNPPGALPVTLIKAAPTVSDQLNVLLARLADGAAWTQIAVSTRVVDAGVLVALHHDQDAIVAVQLENVAGGVELLKWRIASDDANRGESLRHVLRFVTANSHAALPDARTVQRLAERQRIALVRDRAAEVFRSIAEGQRSTAQLLETAAGSLSKLVEDTTTTASATVAGVIGVVALVAANANLLPGWLIVLATLAAVAGVIAVIVSRWRRIDDQEQASLRLLERLRNDPLLPAEELGAMVRSIESSTLPARARGARRTIVVLGTAACVVALAASSWLVWVHHPSSAASTRTEMTTSTTATAVSSPSPGLSTRPAQSGKLRFTGP